MSLRVTAVLLVCLAAWAQSLPRRRRAAEADIQTAETRIDPYMYDRPIQGYGIEGYGAGGPLGPSHGLMYKQPYLGQQHGGYPGGFLHSDISEGSSALGNKGEQIYRHENDGAFLDNNFHAGGVGHHGGFQSGEGYKDNKHHVADDHSNRVFYNGVQGNRKDIGNGQVFDKNTGFAENAFNKQGDSEEKAHQRGHHKTGFHKSYHKDESGNDESYFDSDHDTGNHEYGKKYTDEYGNSFRNGLKGGENMNEYAAGERGEHGYEGNGKLIAQNQGYKDRFGTSGYYGDDSRFGKYGGGQSSQMGKMGYQGGFQNGYNNGHHLGGYGMGPYGY